MRNQDLSEALSSVLNSTSVTALFGIPFMPSAIRGAAAGMYVGVDCSCRSTRAFCFY